MTRLLLCLLVLFAPAVSTAGEALHVGDKAPPFALPDLYGRRITLDYFDGHPGVVIFWSAADPSSTVLLVDFHTYQQKWGRDDLAIVAVNVDGGGSASGAPQPVRAVADRLDIIFPVLLDAEGVTLAAYGVAEIPTAVVIDADGRVAAILRGADIPLRQELKKQLLLAIGDGPAVACTIPRSRSCTNLDESDPSAASPAVMAVRLCVCHGDAAAAQVMLSSVGKEALAGLDMRFALAHLLLLEGKRAEARRAFEALREQHPQASWGEWGLGIMALAEGDAEKALAHLRAANAGGWSIPEAETAVLKYLEGYWRANRAAPREEQFLALYAELSEVRACYRNLKHRG